MSNITQLVKEMSARLNEIADSEQALVRALGDAMSRVDQKLLRDVRGLAREQEMRRCTILLELQNLASRIGTFPTVREPAAGLNYGQPGAKSLAPANGEQKSPAGGDWRQAVKNMQAEFEVYLKNRAASH